MYSIIDIETTGLSPEKEKITEIAIYIHDGNKIIDEFVSLVNPEKSIPYFITRLTGITNDLVENAPKFYEIAKKIIEITENRIFVAHNAEFDYGFIKAEFASLGYEFKRNRLCTVKLSKKIIPGHRSYSLGKLTEELGIEVIGRHRAAGDAFATVRLFEHLLKEDAKSKPLIEEMSYHSIKNLHPEFNKSIIDELPEKTGVYYFYDENKNLIYVGKSKSIRSRIMQHLNNNITKKSIEMKSKITDISYEITGSELVALLLESAEIKKHKPLFNRSQRRSAFNFGLFSFEDPEGYLHLKINTIEGEEIPLTTFHFHQEGIDYLHNLAEKYALCKKLCHLDNCSGECFEAQIHHCQGACTGLESAVHYNLRVNKSVHALQYRSPNFFVIDQGRTNDEHAIIKIAGGRFVGFGYASTDCASNNIEFLHDCIQKYNDNRDIRVIIKGYLNRSKNLKIIEI